MAADATESDVNGEQVLFDLIDALRRQYDISERQITTNRSSRQSVSLRIHGDAGEFPGWGHSSVNVFEMTNEEIPGYVPRKNSITIHTVEQGAPDWE